MSKDKSAVLLAGFGGPERPEDVRPFIDAVVQGRNVPEQRVAAVCAQYQQIGGASPYMQLTKKQASDLETYLNDRHFEVRVYAGFQFSQPSIAAAFKQMSADGVENIAVIIMAPQPASHSRYFATINAARDELHKTGRCASIAFVSSWHTHPLYAKAMADRVRSELDKLDALTVKKTQIIFSAHSIPCQASEHSGYARQVEESAQAVFGELSNTHRLDPPIVVGWQSRSGSPEEKWLEPDISACITQAHTQGKTHVLVVPIGFLVDHVEVLFDLDILAANHARSLNMEMLRASTVSNHPLFIELLSQLSQQTLESLYVRS